MAADRESSFVIRFDGEGGDLTSALNALISQARKASSDISSATNSVELFKGIQAQAKAAADAFFATKQRVDDFRRAVEAIESAGGTVGKELAKQVRDAEKAFASATKELDKQKAALKDARAAMQAAEAASAKLAAEQKRLAAEWQAQNEAATRANAAAQAAVASAVRLAQEVRAIGLAFQANKDALGLKTLRDVQPEIDAVRRSYEQLRDSGRLSFGELSVASARMRERVAELRGEASGVAASFGQLRVQLLAIVGAFAGVTAGASASAAAYRDFAQQIAAVESIAGVSRRQIDQLAQGVRELARTMGVDATESAKALYEIISSGIPADNALAVLAASTRAAVAGLTTVDTAAKVGVGVLNAYGLQVTEIGRVFDVLFQTVKDGVVSFPDLAQNIGEVIPTARAARVSLEEVGAAFVVLTRNGINAAESATSIRSAIQGISAPVPEAQERFRALGIELGNFGSVIEQLAARDLSLSQLRGLVTDTRALKAVQILTQNFRLLRDEIGEMNKAAGAAEAAYRVLADTPQARIDRFRASIRDLSLSFGEFLSSTTGIVQALTGILNAFNALDASTRRTVIEMTTFVAVVGALALTIRTLSVPLNLFVGGLLQSIPAVRNLKLQIDAASLAMRGLAIATAGFIGYDLGKWAREAVPFVSSLGDAIGTLLAAGVQSAALALDGLGAALGLTGESLGDVRARGQRFTDYLRQEFSEILSGARERLRELRQEQTQLSETFGRATQAAAQAVAGVQGAVSGIATNIQTVLTGIERNIQQLEARLGTLVARMGEAVTATQALAQASLANITAQVQAQLAALDALQLSDTNRAQAAVEIERAAAAERLAVLKTYAAQVMAAFDAEAKARLDIARRNGEDLKKVEADITNARRKTLQDVLDAYRSHYQELLNQANQHIAKIKELEGKRRDIAEEVSAKIREIRRSELTSYEQYADRVKEIDALIGKARTALLQGNAEEAERLTKKALGLVDSIRGKVEENGKVVVSQLDANATAISRLTTLEQIHTKAIEAQKTAHREGANAAQAAAQQQQKAIETLTSEVEKLTAQTSQGIELRVTADAKEVEEVLQKIVALEDEEKRTLKIKADVTLAQVELDRLLGELKEGVTVNVEARTEEIEAALKRIDDAEPTVSVNVATALEELGKVEKAAEAIKTVRMKIESNAADQLAVINELRKPIETTWTIRRKVVEERSGGGVVGDGPQLPPSGFARGGPVARPRPLQIGRTFARGGPVFRSPGWRKVPGAGDGDTVPAALTAGSFVMRKSASRYYGDTLMGALARGMGLPRGFALGGIVDALLRGGRRIGSRRSRLTDNLSAGPTGELVEAAIRVFQPLIDASRTLPRSKTGQNLADYLAKVLELIQSTYDPREAADLLQNVASISDNLMGSIRTAHRFRVPIVMGAFATNDLGGPSSPSAAYQALVALMREGRFAAGGPSGTDTVPAWLTPGEWVMRPAAVQKYGADFMHALNRMQVPKIDLARMFAPPQARRFAEGGPVEGARPTNRTQAQASTAVYNTVNVTAAAGALLSEENVRRYIIPQLDKLARRTR